MLQKPKHLHHATPDDDSFFIILNFCCRDNNKFLIFLESREFESNDDGMEETFELEASIRSIEDVDSKFDSNEEDDSSSRELILKSRKRRY